MKIQFMPMKSLLDETWSAFRNRSLLNVKEGFYEEGDLFNEILTENICENQSQPESNLYQRCRKTINRGLDLARARELRSGLDHFKKIEPVFAAPKVSYQCKMLIAAFYSSGLAYLRLKESRPLEADALSLQALAIDNYLIQEHEYHILEMHRVQQLVNLARIQMAMGNRDEALRLLFPLFRCFENRGEFPGTGRFNDLPLFRKKYESVPLFSEPIGPDEQFLPMDKVYKTPVTRFGCKPDGTGRSALESRFMLDFSTLSFDLIRRMLDLVMIEFIWFTKGMDPAEIRAVFNAAGVRSVEDLEGLKKYRSTYLFLAIKLHAGDEDRGTFLELLKSFCELSPYRPAWDAVASDFCGFCISSDLVATEIKEQVKNLADANALQTKF